MKKNFVIFAIMLALIFSCLAVISCKSEDVNGATEDVAAATQEPSEQATEEAPKATDSKDKTNNQSSQSSSDKNNTNKDKQALIEELLDTRHELRADENGEFKVVVMSDIQGSDSHVPIPQSVLDNIKTIVDREKPDLIVFDGDNTNGLHSESAYRQYIGEMVSYIEESKIPWAHVYGNHDHEGGISKEKQSEIYSEFEYCVSKVGTVSGVGNFVLPVLSYDGSKILYNVWCIDSGSYISLSKYDITLDSGDYSMGAYDYIKPDQIEWYRETSALLEEYNGAKIPAIMAFHIPLRETADAWAIKDKYNLEYTGVKRENIGSSSINSGMFAAVIERGDVKAIVNGHDHINDFMIKQSSS